jgi:hypothetical protein
LLGKKRVCELQENVSSTFVKFMEKAYYYLQYMELKHVDPDSKETRRAASTLLPHVTRHGMNED